MCWTSLYTNNCSYKLWKYIWLVLSMFIDTHKQFTMFNVIPGTGLSSRQTVLNKFVISEI